MSRHAGSRLEEEQAIAAYWLAYVFEAGPRIRAMLARVGCGSVPVSARVVIPQQQVAPAPVPVPEPLPVRSGAPDLPFDLRQRFGLQ